MSDFDFSGGASFDDLADCYRRGGDTQCRRMAKASGLEYLGRGLGREVFALDQDRVLKIAWAKGKGAGNYNEVYYYHNVPAEIKNTLARPLNWSDDDSWLVMERGHGQVMSQSERDRWLCKKQVSRGWFTYDVDRRDIMLVRGKRKLIDYGKGIFPVSETDDWRLPDRCK